MGLIQQIQPPGCSYEVVSAPAVATDWTTSLDAFSIWEIIAIRFQFVTDANVASRRVTLVVSDGGAELFRVSAPIDQTAGATWEYCAAQYLGQPPINTGTAMPIALPHGLTLHGSPTIAVSTANIQAGDQFGAARIRLRNWGMPLSV